MQASELLFEPGRIGKMDLKNRLVMGPMGNRYATEDGYVTKRITDFYAERARGGVGLITSETFNVSSDSHTPFRSSLYDDTFNDGLREHVKVVHRNGAPIVIQLIKRTGAIGVNHPEGHAVFVPSVLPFMRTDVTVKDASVEDIARVVDEFAEAARRAKDAGFDGVEFHACHGGVCALSAFLSPFLNRRTDRYGGSTENRTRIVCEVLARTRVKVGPDFPLLVRINGCDGLEGGTTPDEAARQAVLLEKVGVDAISVSSGMEPWKFWMSIPPYPMREGISVEYAAVIKKAVKVPVIVAGRIGPMLGEKILKECKADFIAMVRPLLADPYLPDKLKQGRLKDIVNCIYCNNCMEPGLSRSCTVNPSVFQERDSVLAPAKQVKNVIVAGGGLAGMEAARVLAERGHKVSLYERGAKLGGQWNIAAMEEDKKHFSEVVGRLSWGMVKAGVEIKLGEELTADIVKQSRPDVVVVATGATPASLDVPGVGGRNVVQAVDVIAGKTNVGDRVAVLGGKFMGMEVAVSLAKTGKKVTLITRRELGRGIQRTLYFAFSQLLRDNGVLVYQNAPVVEIMDNGVYFLSNGDLTFVEVDSVVLAVGSMPQDKLAKEIKSVSPYITVYEIGDCKEPRNALKAINEGAEVGRLV